MRKRENCWCNEAGTYVCLDCGNLYEWSKLSNEKKVFALRWLKAEQQQDPAKSIALHIERDKRFPQWDFYPEDIPSKIWKTV